MILSKWRWPLDAKQLPCHSADIVTKCLLKLQYKHHATCALLAIQKSMLDYDRKVAKWWSDHEHCHSNIAQVQDLWPEDSSICNLAWFCTLIGFCYGTLQLLKAKNTHTERRIVKYLIRWNSQGIYDIDRLENQYRHPHAMCLGYLNIGFYGDLNHVYSILL